MDQSRFLSRLPVLGLVTDTGGPTKAHHLIKTDETGFLSPDILPTTLSIGSIDGDLVVAGNLTVNGTTTTLNTEELVIEDTSITLSNGAFAADDAKIRVDRAGADGGYASLKWDEFDQRWKAGFEDNESTLAYLSELNSHIINYNAHVANFNNHAANDSLHLTPGQNTLLDSITTDATHINYVSDVTGPIQSQFSTVNANLSSLFVEISNLQDNDTTINNNLAAHIANDELHLTPTQNTLLDSITVDASEINLLDGLGVNVQTQFAIIDLGFAGTNANINNHIADTEVHVTATQSALLHNLTVTASEINQLSGLTLNVANEFTTVYENITEIGNNTDTHIADTNNPHNVTKAQVGLGNVTNDAQVRVATADTITAQHTFNPTVAGAPFVLGANATGQLVTGLNAAQVNGKTHGSIGGCLAIVGTTCGTAPVLDATGKLDVARICNASTSTYGVVYHATPESIACNIGNAVITAENAQILTCSGLNTLFVGGDKLGNPRGSLAIDIQPSRATAAQVASNSKSIAIGNCMTISGAAAIGIGSSVASAGTCTIAIGVSTCSTTCAGTAIGQLTCSLAAHSVAIGSGVALGIGAFCSTAIGASVNLGASASSSTGIGTAVSVAASVTAGHAIGCNALIATGADYGLAIGNTVASCASKGIAIGSTASVQLGATGAIALGSLVNAWGICSIAIGNSNTATCNPYSIAIGANAFAGQTGSIAIGCSARACAVDAIVIGNTPGSTISTAGGSVLIGGNNNALSACRATIINGCFNTANGLNATSIGSANTTVSGSYAASLGSRFVNVAGSGAVALGAYCGTNYCNNSIITGCYAASVGNNSITIGAGEIKGVFESSLIPGGNQIAKQVLTASVLGCGATAYFCSDNCNYFCMSPAINGYVAFEALVLGREACMGSGAISCSFKVYGYASCYSDGISCGWMTDIVCCMPLHSNGSGLPVVFSIDENGGFNITSPSYFYESYWIMDLQTTRLVYPGLLGSSC